MNLPETLVFTDITHLNRIATQYDLSCNLSSKNELIQTILQNILNKDKLHERLEQLTDIERRFLTLILLENREGYTFEDLCAKASQAIKAFADSSKTLPSNRALIATLFNNGWIYQNKGTKVVLYKIPHDLKKRLVQSLKSGIGSLYIQPLEAFAPEPSSDLLMDILTFLRFVCDELVLITNEGVIHKRQLQQLLQRMTFAEKPIDGKEWRFGYGRRFHNYPDRFSLIYDYCFQQQLVEERATTLQITDIGRMVVLGEKELDMVDVYTFWVNLYRKPIRNIPFLLAFIGLYCSQWISLEALRKEVTSYIRPFYYDSADDVFYKRIIAPLTWMDYLKRSHHDSTPYVQLSSKANALFEKSR